MPIGTYTRQVLRKPRADQRAREGRQRGAGREEHRRQGRARRGGRRLRLPHRRAAGPRAGCARSRSRPGRSRRCATRSPSSASSRNKAAARAWVRTILDERAGAAAAAAGRLRPAVRLAPRRFALVCSCSRSRWRVAFLLLPIVAIFLRGRASRGLARRARGATSRATRFRVTLKTNADRDGADPRRRDAGRVLPRDAALPRARARRSRSSSCRSCCRRPSPGSACSPRSAGSGCSASSSTRSGSRSAFTQAAVVLAVTFVASPFYIRQAIAAVRGRRPTTLLDAVAHARRRARRGRSAASRCRSPAAVSAPARRSPSRAAWASSARRSCSPAASRA